MKAVVICIEGYWKDERTKPHSRFERRCVVMPAGATDSIRDEVLREVGDDSIFFVFEEGEAIVGEHLDFVVDFYNPISVIELGELQ